MAQLTLGIAWTDYPSNLRSSVDGQTIMSPCWMDHNEEYIQCIFRIRIVDSTLHNTPYLIFQTCSLLYAA